MMAISIIAAYLLGSIPFGYLFVRIFVKSDIRESGSGGTGATNVSRKLGLKFGAIVALLDILKGYFAVAIANALVPNEPIVIPLCAIIAVLGHIYPVWIGFKGGKGVSTAFGVALFISPIGALAALAAFAMAYATSRFVSVGSLSGVIVFAISYFAFPNLTGIQTIWEKLFGVVLACLIFFTHRKNFMRLFKGKELKVR